MTDAAEFVTGTQLLRYCTAARLAMPDRLGLLVTVCEVLAHAHRHGVTHGDVGAASVLVVHSDQAPTVRVIGFGRPCILGSDVPSQLAIDQDIRSCGSLLVELRFEQPAAEGVGSFRKTR